MSVASPKPLRSPQIVECGALPVLVQMLRSEDMGVHYEAVGVIGNLVHSSVHIKRKVGSGWLASRADNAQEEV